MIKGDTRSLDYSSSGFRFEGFGTMGCRGYIEVYRVFIGLGV